MIDHKAVDPAARRVIPGDVVTLEATGAYVSTYASQRFNGFAPLAEHYV